MSSLSKMNIDQFKLHLASRKVNPEPLRTAEVQLELPSHYSNGTNTALLDPCRVLFCNLEQGTQSIILNVPNKSNIFKWIRQFSDYEGKDIRLSRFQRAYGGMMNPPIRVWEKCGDGFVRSKHKIKVGSLVQCACTVRESKGKTYFDLHRDILLIESGTRSVSYFSDEDI
jgi:hypothetical protein